MSVFSNHKPSIYVVIKWWIWPLQLAGTLEISEWNPPIVNDCFDLHGQQNNSVVYYKKVQVLLLLLDETHTNMSCSPRVIKASFCKIHKVTRQTCLHVWEAGKLWDDITWLSSNNSLTVRDGVSTVGPPSGRGRLGIQHGTLLGSWLKPSVTAWREESRGGGKVGGCCWWWWWGGHWMWKPVWLISNREGGGGAPLLSGPNPSPSPICWWGVLRSAASPDNEGFAGVMGVTTDQREFFFFGRGLLVWAKLGLVCKWRGPYYDNASSSLPNAPIFIPMATIF